MDVFLVPGFLGFSTLGRLSYFGHVRRLLTARFASLGLDAQIHVVRPPPTASLPTRAARVAAAIAKEAQPGGGPVHLIGHSSGGLDVRLLTAPGVGLSTTHDVEQMAERVRTVITVSTPHHGTPLASFFTTLRGQQLLQLLSLNTIYVLSFGRLPLSALLWMGGLVVRYGDLVANSEFLDEVFGRLLEDFTVKRRRAVRELLHEVVQDQALMLQLAPEAMEVFNASVLERPGIRYGAVVSRAPAPSLRSTIAAGFDPAAQVTHAVYGVLYRLIASTTPRELPRLASHQTLALRSPYGATTPANASDGIVPTRSQVWGNATVVSVAVADHLDVLGHFRDAARDPPHVDWLVSGSHFTRDRFEALWDEVAHFVVGDTQRQGSRRDREAARNSFSRAPASERRVSRARGAHGPMPRRLRVARSGTARAGARESP